jgi:hypothetical protein
MPTSATSARLAEAQRLLDQALELSRDFGDDVEAAVRAASEHPLDEQTATRLYTRILRMLRGSGHDLDDEERLVLAEEVRAEVARLVAAVSRPEAPARSTGLELVARNGMEPHTVTPVPIFNTTPIPMVEGYVDVTTVPLWRENHRVEFYVEEFYERNGRQPDADELLSIMHGTLEDLPSLRAKKDPFGIIPLAESIARKGVQQPPVLTWDGEPKDGNRRISAAKYVLASDRFSVAEKERARWVRVWRAPAGTTEDQFESIVVSLNFESDHKEPWPEYVKGRLVAGRYQVLRDNFGGVPSVAQEKKLRDQVAAAYAITAQQVQRYVRMVKWAEDYEAYHVDERGLDPAAVRHKTDKDFQRFYEIEAGRAGTKLTEQLEKDDALRPVVYDLMYDVLDSGAQVRELHKVVADEAALKLLRQAHDEAGVDHIDQALSLAEEAIAEAKRKSPTKRLGLEQWLRGAVERLEHTSPEDWHRVADTELLADLRRVLPSAVGALEGELASRGLKITAVEHRAG